MKSALISGDKALFLFKLTPPQTGTMGPSRTWVGRGNKVLTGQHKKPVELKFSPRVMDIGGVPYLMPLVQREKL